MSEKKKKGKERTAVWLPKISLVQFMKHNFILKHYFLSPKVILHIDFFPPEKLRFIAYNPGI